jgi:hypothetical protein
MSVLLSPRLPLRSLTQRRDFSKPDPRRFIGGFDRLAIAAFMEMATSEAVLVARGELRTRTALVLEAIALHHQIAVLERIQTRRPCFRRWDRLLWVLLSRWWPQWRKSLMIVQPETVLRWRRNGWSALWRYRSRGRRGGGTSSASRHGSRVGASGSRSPAGR